jgi:hypothetical protein
LSLALEKSIVTLGELFAADAQRLMHRRQTRSAWLASLQPVIERNSGRAEESTRFERHEGVHKASPAKIDRVEKEVEELREGDGELLPAATRQRLRPLVGADADQARVHVDKRADALTRGQHADAVTMGKDIYFRSGAFAPETPVGLGLIAHELTHVAESNRPGVGWRRSTQEGLRNEEDLASRRERSAAQSQVSPVVASAYVAPRMPARAPAVSVPRGAAPMPEPAQQRPMRADVDRPQPDPVQAPPQAGPSLDVLRRTMFRDIMNQVRVEFERGA